MTILSRRELARLALVTAAGAAASPLAAQTAKPETQLSDNPFKLLGVASGDPWASGVVLWARLAFDLADTERWGLGADAYRLTWEITPESGKGQVRTGTAIASREKAYAVHVEVAGLAPGQSYIYTFKIGAHEASGRTKTAPAGPLTATSALRLCFCSCAEYENENFFVYDQMAKEAPDAIVHLGDYIYEETYDRYYTKGPDTRARRLKFDRDEPCRTLAQYRRRYAEHKMDPMLQRAHAAAPWIVTWDDHETSNDYAGSEPADGNEADFLNRRIAAYRAYFENQPIRLSTLPVRDGRRQLYRALSFGPLLNLYMLDERQYRDPQACRFDKLPGGKNVGLADCPGLETNSRSILGAGQEKWLEPQLQQSKAHWNILAQGVMFAHLETRQDPRLKGRTDPHMWNDTWSGYLPARQRMIDLLQRQGKRNTIVVSGDIHSHFVNRVFKDWRKPGEGLVTTELVSAAVSSFVRDLTPIVSDEANKNVVAFYDNASHGYVSCNITPAAINATMVTIRDKDRQALTSTADRSVIFRIPHGRLDPQRA